MDLYLRGTALFNKGLTPEYMAQARALFERALVLDAGNIDALVGTARVDATMAIGFMTDDRAARFAAAEAALTKVLSVAPNHAFAHFLLGLIEMSTNRAAQGIAELERALSVDRNLAFAQADIGLAKVYVGRAEETEAHVNEALRLSPRDTFAYIWMYVAGLGKLYLGRDEEAIAWLQRAIETNRNYPIVHFSLAASLAHLGRLDEARAVAATGLSLDPSFTIRRFGVSASTGNPTYLAQRERVIEGMRKAGVPEG